MTTNLKDFSVDELKELEVMIKAEKKTRKSSANEEKALANDARISEVNDLIGKNLLGVGTTVKILYGSKNVEITATVVGVCTKDRDSLTLESDAFDGKFNDKGKKRRYIDKARFVSIA